MSGGAAPLAEVAAALDAAYPPAWADDGDPAGLVCGDPGPGASVGRVLFAVDVTAGTVAEAARAGADLLVAHRPPAGCGGGAPGGPMIDGRLVYRLARSGVALYVAHSSAEAAVPGVSGALAGRLGLRAVRPLVPIRERIDQVVTFVPSADAGKVIDALAAAGAGVVGNYTRCVWTVEGAGSFLPGTGARPAIGTVGRVRAVPETRVEMVAPRSLREAVTAALHAAHPYEEPAYYLYELAGAPADRGRGRLAQLPAPLTLAEFAAHAAARLPATPAGVRAAGDPGRTIRTVAVHGGDGEDLLADAAGSGADAYLTGDLRQEPVSSCLASGGPALVAAGNWATRRPWLDAAAARLGRDLADAGLPPVAALVSDLVTDPWTLRA